MPTLRKSLLAAGGVALLVSTAAFAASKYTHHLNIRLPNGEIAQVDYVGDVAPRVVVQPAAEAHDPIMTIGFPAFAPVDDIFADMAREEVAMMRRVAQMQREIAAHPAATWASARPSNGTVTWSYVSTSTSANGCTQTVEWHSGNAAGKGAEAGQPQVIRTSSGTCEKAVKDAPVHEVSAVQPPRSASTHADAI